MSSPRTVCSASVNVSVTSPSTSSTRSLSPKSLVGFSPFPSNPTIQSGPEIMSPIILDNESVFSPEHVSRSAENSPRHPVNENPHDNPTHHHPRRQSGLTEALLKAGLVKP